MWLYIRLISRYILHICTYESHDSKKNISVSYLIYQGCRNQENPPVFGKPVHPIPTSGADYPHSISTCPNFRPCDNPVSRAMMKIPHYSLEYGFFNAMFMWISIHPTTSTNYPDISIKIEQNLRLHQRLLSQKVFHQLQNFRVNLSYYVTAKTRYIPN